MSTRADPFPMSRSRTLTSTVTATIGATVAVADKPVVFGGPPPTQMISQGTVNLSDGPFPSYRIEQSGPIGTPGITLELQYGYTFRGVFHITGTENLLSAGYSYHGSPPGTIPPEYVFNWATFSWTISIEITTTGTFQDVFFSGFGSGNTVVREIVPPGGTCVRTTTVEGTTFTLPLVAPAADWDARLVNFASCMAQTLGMYGVGLGLGVYSTSLQGPSYFDTDAAFPPPLIVQNISGASVGASCSGSYDISGTGITMPGGLGGFGSPFGSAGGGTVSVSAPPDGKSYSGGYASGASPVHTWNVHGTLWDLSGHLNAVPTDVHIHFRGGNIQFGAQAEPFKIPGVTGSFTKSLTVGGRRQTITFSDGINTYAEQTNNYLLAPNGVDRIQVDAHTDLGTPLIVLKDDNITNIRARPAFETRLPVKNGGIRLKQKPFLNLFGAPWVIGGANGWTTGGSVTVSTSGPGGAYLRLVAASNGGGTTITLPNEATVPFIPRIPYRFVTIRFRSLGAARLPLDITIQPAPTGGRIVTKSFVSGADGEFVEVTIDLMRDFISLVQPYGPPRDNIKYLRNGHLSAPAGFWRIDGLKTGTYEIEFIQGRRQFNSTASLLMPHPARYYSDPTGQNEGMQGVFPLHGTTDGFITLSRRVMNNFPAPSIKVLVDAVNSLHWPAWEAEELQPVRGDKPAKLLQKIYGLPVGDLTDSEASAGWLAGGGIFSNGQPTLDVPVDETDGLEIPLQPTMTGVVTYPGAGQPFNSGIAGALSSGGYGDSTTLNVQAIVKGQVVGLLLGGEGSQVIAKVKSTGADAGKGTAPDDTGYTPTDSPNAHQGSQIVITAEPKGQIVDWSTASSSTGLLTLEGSPLTGLTGPFDHFNANVDFSNLSLITMGRGRIWAMFTTEQRVFLGVMATDSPRQLIYVANLKKIQKRRTSDDAKVSESEEHPVSEWLSLVFDPRTDFLYALGQIGAPSAHNVKLFRSKDGGQTIKELIAFTGKSFKMERDSERQWLVILYQDTDDAVQRRISRDGGATFDAAAPALEGEEELTGAVIDLEQNPRTNSGFYLALGDTDEDGNLTGARFYRSQDSGIHWKQIYTLDGKTFKFERDSERNWFIILREDSGTGELDRHLSRDNGETWIDPVPAMAGDEVLTGHIIDLEQDARANGTLFMTLAETDEEDNVTSSSILKSMDSGINWKPIESNRIYFILDTDALDGEMILQ